MPAFASVVIDVDSTLCGVEGIDFLAERRGAEVRDMIVALTDKAMKGEIRLESVYEQRLTTIEPTRDDLAALARAYSSSIARGAGEAIDAMRSAGARLVLVSGGIREAIAPVARQLGFADDELFAVSLSLSPSGRYLAVHQPAPLASHPGFIGSRRGYSTGRDRRGRPREPAVRHHTIVTTDGTPRLTIVVPTANRTHPIAVSRPDGTRPDSRSASSNRASRPAG